MNEAHHLFETPGLAASSFWFHLAEANLRAASAIIKCRWWERRHPVFIRRPDGTKKKRKEKKSETNVSRKVWVFNSLSSPGQTWLKKKTRRLFFLDSTFLGKTKQNFFVYFSLRIWNKSKIIGETRYYLKHFSPFLPPYPESLSHIWRRRPAHTNESHLGLSVCLSPSAVR